MHAPGAKPGKEVKYTRDTIRVRSRPFRRCACSMKRHVGWWWNPSTTLMFPRLSLWLAKATNATAEGIETKTSNTSVYKETQKGCMPWIGS